MQRFRVGDRVISTNTTGKTRTGTVTRSWELKDSSGFVLEPELLDIALDDGTYLRNNLPAGVKPIEQENE